MKRRCVSMTPPDTQPLAHVLITDTDWVIPCRPRQPILNAAYEAGIALPYACRRGICGLCAADLLEGTVAPIDALPMTNQQCLPSQVLLCRCTPVSETVKLRPVSWQRLAQPRRLPPV